MEKHELFQKYSKSNVELLEIHKQYFDLPDDKALRKSDFNMHQHFLIVTNGLDQNRSDENMINWEEKDQDTLALIKYIADEDKLEKVLENPQVIKTPVVRNGKQSTLGYQPDVWKGWN